MLLANFTLDSINNYSICKAVFIATVFTLYTVHAVSSHTFMYCIYSYSLHMYCTYLQLFTIYVRLYVSTAIHYICTYLQLFTIYVLYLQLFTMHLSSVVHYVQYLQLFTLFLQLLTSYLDLFTIVYKAIHSVAFPFVSTLRFNIYPLCIYCCSAISTYFHNVSTVLMFFCNYSFSLCFLGCSLCIYIDSLCIYIDSLCIYIDSLCIYMDSPCIYSCLL